MHAGLHPDRLGAQTTISFAFTIAGNGPGGVPSPLTDIDLRLPGGMTLATSTLGLAFCLPQALLAEGLESCSPNAQIGYGSATVKIPTDNGIIAEPAKVEALMGPPNPAHTELLFFAEGSSPVAAQLVFPGAILDDHPPYSNHIDTIIPLIPTWPGGPDVAVTSFSSTIGPQHLTYRERAGGKTIVFHPTGIATPHACPRGGFPFAAVLSFLDKSKMTAKTNVPCPRR